MPRLVLIRKNKPVRICPNKRALWICQCGLSKNKPFCDGSHTMTQNEDENKFYSYSDLTQNQSLVPVTKTLNEIVRKSKDKIIFKSDTRQVIRLGSSSKLFNEVYKIRQLGGAKILSDSFDESSDIYLFKIGTQYCATMRATQARRGLLDCEDFYPDFVRNFSIRNTLASASRLYKKPDINISHEDIFKFLLQSFKDQYKDGIRVDIINATLKMKTYYTRFGYAEIGREFIHPRTKVRSIAMVYIAHSEWKCFLTDQLRETFKEGEKINDFDFDGLKNIIQPSQV